MKTGAQLGEPIRTLDGWVSAIAFSPDGTRMVTGSGGRHPAALERQHPSTDGPITALPHGPGH